METREAKKVLAQFDNWLNAARRMREVIEATEQMEQRAKEADRRRKAAEDTLRQLEGDRASLSQEVEALRQQAREAKLSTEHETQRVKERARAAREAAEKEAAEVEAQMNQRVQDLQAHAKAVEDECKTRERRAREAATKAETNLRDLRKRLGAV